MKTAVSFRIDSKAAEHLKEMAQRENRSLNNWVETIIEAEYNKNKEMAKMKTNKMWDVLQTLRGKNFEVGAKILNQLGLKNNYTRQEELSDSYFKIDDENWFCYTCEYTQSEDYGVIFGNGYWNALIDDVMYEVK